MFEQMKNIDSAFKHIRLFAVTLIVCVGVICCFTVFQSYRMVRASQNRIYLLANGKALEAYGADRKDNIPVEARDHVKMFHQYFFNLDPDDQVIEANINKALYLADHTAKRQYTDLKEKGYYANLISGNISQDIEVDSIVVDINQYPHYFKCYARQQLLRATSTVTRLLVTEGYLRNVSRSDNNPHGFLIEKWATVQNTDLKVEQR